MKKSKVLFILQLKFRFLQSKIDGILRAQKFCNEPEKKSSTTIKVIMNSFELFRLKSIPSKIIKLNLKNNQISDF